MTKAELVAKIAESTGINHKDVFNVVEEFMTVVKDNMSDGKTIYLRGFGTFSVKERAAKLGRNITKNTTVTIPAHNIPHFKASNAFKKLLK